MISFALGDNLSFVVDEEDFEDVILQRWHAVQTRPGCFYARRWLRGGQCQYLHTFLTGWSQVDHIDGDRLNNSRANLRPATNLENGANKRKQSTFRQAVCSSQFKGVTWDQERGLWKVMVIRDRKRHFIGRYQEETDAARAYDVAARQHFGDFARLNFGHSGG